jgi:pyruvate-formate lyase
MGRIDILREKMLKSEHGKYRILMPSDWSVSSLDCSIKERKAHAQKLMLEQMPIFIEDNELIVGSRTVYAPRHHNQTEINDTKTDVSVFVYPQYLNDEEKEKYGTSGGGSKGHYVAGYRKILESGFGGIINQARNRKENETSQEKRDYLNAICIAYEGASILVNRYSDLAFDMAQKHTGTRKTELEKIAEVCRNIAHQPPKDLYEALQLFWFTHVALMVENQCLMSFGRFDQYMDGFYSKYPSDEAQELLECAFIKLNDQADIKQGEGFYGSDNLMLSGLKSDGNDATNNLTYACLDVLDHLRLVNPQVNIRLHKDSPSELIERISDLARQGCGQLSFYNDDAIVPSLVNVGFPAEDAREYVLDACQDIIIEGNSDFYIGGSISLTPLLLNVLDEINDDAGFNQFLENYKQKIAKSVHDSANGYINSLNTPLISPLPFLSATLEDCIGNASDVTKYGLKYRDKGMFVMSPVNAVNSLAGIKKVVFDDKFASLSDVKKACKSNFEGYETLRQKLLSAPKWGNDDDYVDLLGKDIFEFSCREILKHNIDSEARFLSGIHQPHHVITGAGIGATPDGRKAGEPIPVTLSPSNGTERRGPTAIMKSVTKIDPMMCQWNSALTLNFHPTAVAGEEGLKKFEMLLRTFFAMGGIQLQTNILNVEILRVAQHEPEMYRDLVIRVWGFSAYFVELSRQYQDEVIFRTAHAI